MQHGRAVGVLHRVERAEEFREALLKVPQKPAKAKLVLNRDGQLTEHEENIALFLAEQLTRPVYWSTSLETLHHCGVRDFVTLGPGAILRALVRKNLGSEVRVWSTDGEGSWRSLLEALGES